MNISKKWNVLYIQQEKSFLNSDTNVLTELFNTVDKAQNKEEVFKLFDSNKYDIIIGDITVDPEGVILLKEIKDKKSEQIVFALVAPKDTDKLYTIANFDINAFELTAEQFDLALEAIAEFDPKA